jgi:hypothetical protein
MRFDSYVAAHSNDDDWRALNLVRPAAAEPARFDLAAVNGRLRALCQDTVGDDRRSDCSLRVELTGAELPLVSRYGDLGNGNSVRTF